jgi:hypothetical protein
MTMKRPKYLAALLFAAALSGCGEKAIQNIASPPPATSRIRFFNFGVNAPSVNFYANETKMTAVTSSTGTEATTGISYGGVGPASNYAVIAPGQYSVSGRIAATTDKDKPISTVPVTVADGKFYSVFQSGFYDATAKTVDGFAVEDTFTVPTDVTTASVRFVNAISNSQPMTLYIKGTSAGATEIAIGGAVPYKGASAFVTIPAGPYDIYTRVAGSSTNVLTRTGVGFSPTRVNTITARGDITVAPSTTTCSSTNKTCLDNTSNY